MSHNNQGMQSKMAAFLVFTYLDQQKAGNCCLHS